MQLRESIGVDVNDVVHVYHSGNVDRKLYGVVHDERVSLAHPLLSTFLLNALLHTAGEGGLFDILVAPVGLSIKDMPAISSLYVTVSPPSIDPRACSHLLEALPLLHGAVDALVWEGGRITQGPITFNVDRVVCQGAGVTAVGVISKSTKVLLSRGSQRGVSPPPLEVWLEDVGRTVGGLTSTCKSVIEKVIDVVSPCDPRQKKFPGLLLTGPHGVGKSMVAHAVAAASTLKVFKLDAPSVFKKYAGSSEEALVQLFKEAVDSAPSIIVIDEVDAVGSNRSNCRAILERSLCTQLISSIDYICASRANVAIIATTSRVESMDPALLSSFRLGTVVTVPSPSVVQRGEILSIHLKALLEKGTCSHETICEIAKRSAGCVGADLAALAREVVIRYLERSTIASSGCKVVEMGNVIEEDIANALEKIKPSTLLSRHESGGNEEPSSTSGGGLSSLVGMDEIIESIHTSVLLPLLDSSRWDRMGISPPRGVLLYGPSGCGKTSLALAVSRAAAGYANYINIQCSSVVSKVVGESEKAISDIFTRARAAAPCILILDQIETLAPVRGSDTSTEATFDRLLSTLLMEIDGIFDGGKLIVIATTTNKDSLDTAILRPGRLDQHILMGLPDPAARSAILQSLMDRTPLSPSVDKTALLGTLVLASHGYSTAEMENIFREAAMVALRESINVEAITDQHLMQALQLVKLGR